MTATPTDGPHLPERATTITTHSSPRLFMHPIGKLIILLILVGMIVIQVATHAQETMPPGVAIVVIIGDLLVLGVGCSFQRIHITPTHARIVWFPLFRKTVPLIEITDVTVTHVLPWAYGGWGLRLAHGVLALTNRGGPGVEITFRAGIPVVMTVPDPDRIRHLLRPETAADPNTTIASNPPRTGTPQP